MWITAKVQGKSCLSLTHFDGRLALVVRGAAPAHLAAHTQAARAAIGAYHGARRPFAARWRRRWRRFHGGAATATPVVEEGVVSLCNAAVVGWVGVGCVWKQGPGEASSAEKGINGGWRRRAAAFA